MATAQVGRRKSGTDFPSDLEIKVKLSDNLAFVKKHVYMPAGISPQEQFRNYLSKELREKETSQLFLDVTGAGVGARKAMHRNE